MTYTHAPHSCLTDNLGIISQQEFQFVHKVHNVFKKMVTRGDKIIKLRIILAIQHLFLKKLPETIDEVEIRSVRGQGIPARSLNPQGVRVQASSGSSGRYRR